jgi:hypothetical protein
MTQKKITYILHTPEYSYPLDSVNAKNRTEARQLIGDIYRQDVPRQAKAHGYYAFSDCRIEWVEEEELFTGDTEVADDRSPEPTHRVEEEKPTIDPWRGPFDQRIGVLCRSGSPVYYVHLGAGMMYIEGTLKEIQSELDAFDQDYGS